MVVIYSTLNLCDDDDDDFVADGFGKPILAQRRDQEQATASSVEENLYSRFAHSWTTIESRRLIPLLSRSNLQ